MIPNALCASALLLLFAPLAHAAEPYAKNDQNAIYAMGLLQARQLKGMLITKDELAIFHKGLDDGFADEPKLDPQTQGANIRSLRDGRMQVAAEIEAKAAVGFVAKATKQRGAVVTDSGLVFLSVRDGLGERPTVLDQVTVHYHGTLRDGTVFDSSVDRGSPAKFALNRVIPCWTEGLQLMKVGGKAKLVCPAEIAYGSRGTGAQIKPGAALAFEVELISIDTR